MNLNTEQYLPRYCSSNLNLKLSMLLMRVI